MKKIESENCGPGCDCGKPSGNIKAKAAVCLIVLLAVCGIFVYKAKTSEQAAVKTPTAFTGPVVNEVNDVNGQKAAVAAIDKQDAVVKPVEEKKIVGVYLDSLASLNKVAANLNAVFVFIPAKEDGGVSKEITDAIASAEQKIKSAGVQIGLYTLQAGSPEYANLASKLTLPSMLVMTKGRGMGAVSGEITETKILQAYVASSQAGGCCPSGSGAAGCK